MSTRKTRRTEPLAAWETSEETLKQVAKMDNNKPWATLNQYERNKLIANFEQDVYEAYGAFPKPT